MYNMSDLPSIKVNDSVRNNILMGLMILQILSLLSGYFLSSPGIIEGTELGRIIFLLFILSEVPIVVNYFYFVTVRLGLPTDSISNVFAAYYTPSLIFHSGIYTIVIGLTVAHILLLIQQSIYCMIFIFILGLLWVIDYILWFRNWPLYPRSDHNVVFLYWLQWTVLFGTLIGLPFHVRTWSLFWVSVFPTLTFGSLLIIIFLDLRKKKTNTQKMEKLETQNPITQVIKG